MLRREMLRHTVAGVGWAACAAPALARQEGRAAPRPNILFLLADDMRWDSMGCAGNDRIRTPNLDRLAARGVRFENAFVTTSICAPNRACILAGQHQRTTGIKDFATPFSEEALERTYPVLLRRAGYYTGFIGKWGVGALSEAMLALPASRFDYWRGFVDQGQYFHEVDGRRQHLTTERVPAQTDEFLSACPTDRPFCLSISFKAPHGPWQNFDPRFGELYTGDQAPLPPATFTREAYESLPPPIRGSLNTVVGPARDHRWGARKDRDYSSRVIARYYRLVTGLDLALGRIRDLLDKHGRARNTVIVFTSDNGHFLYERGLLGKWLMYEPSIRVPLIVMDPRLPAEQRGQIRSDMALTIDVAPTILSLADVATPEIMQGRDLMPLVRGRQVAWRTDWFYDHTFTLPPPRTIAKCQGVRTERWKYIRYLDTNPYYEELFDLAQDPDELHNLASEPRCAAVLATLRERYEHYRRVLPDRRPDPMEYGHYRTVSISNEHADVPHDFTSVDSLGQSFRSEGVKLTSVSFRTPTWGKTDIPAGLRVELLQEGPAGRVLAQAVIERAAIRNNALHTLRFDVAVRVGQPLYLRVSPLQPLPPQTVAWWGYAENRYPDGTAFAGDVPRDHDMGVSFMYEDPEGFAAPVRDPGRIPERTLYRVRKGRELRGRHAPDITRRAVVLSGVIDAAAGDGVILAQGGAGNGIALFLADGHPAMAVRRAGHLTVVRSPTPLGGGRVRIEGRLAADGRVSVSVQGAVVATGHAPGLLEAQPGDGLEAGADHHTPVGDYASPYLFQGRIFDAVVRIAPREAIGVGR